jgi:probable F420-dependent oxidoreductase
LRVMRVGLALPHYDFSFPDGVPLSWERLLESALRAERLGFDSLWISDHFFLGIDRYGGPEGPMASIEPFTALAAIATSTDRARLGTLVACAPFRHPGHVAKMATTIDLLSGGRFDLGMGAGWYREEFEAFGYPFPRAGERFSVLQDHVEAVAALFGPGPVDLETTHVRLSGAFNNPRPAQPGGPPVWIGGKGGDRLLRLVARHAAGWNTVWRWTPEAHFERVRALRAICEAEGRDPDGVRLSVGLYTLVGEDDRDLVARFRRLQRWAPGGALDGELLDDYARGTLTGTAEGCVDRLARFAGSGVEEVILAPASLPFAIFDWSMVDLIAEAIIPAAHRLAG